MGQKGDRKAVTKAVLARMDEFAYVPLAQRIVTTAVIGRYWAVVEAALLARGWRKPEGKE